MPGRRKKLERVRIPQRIQNIYKVKSRIGQRGNRTQHYTEEQVADALRACGGIKSHAGKLLAEVTGVGTGNSKAAYAIINVYLERYPNLKDVLREAKETRLDDAESALIGMITDPDHRGHANSVRFYLETMGRERGFVKRSEMTGADGGPIKLEDIKKVDLSELNEKELSRLERIYTKMGVKFNTHTVGDNGARPNYRNGRDSEGEVESQSP